MLILPQTVKVKWNGKNKKWFIEKGYTLTKFGDEFEVNVLDLSPCAQQYVKVLCDFCNRIIEKRYVNYYNSNKENGDACKQCKGFKISKGKFKYTFEDVKLEFEKRNFILLETEYLGYSKNHRYICNKGHQTSIIFQHLLQGSGCRECAFQKLANERKKSFDEVKNIFEKSGCVLLTQEYKNNRQMLDYICVCGNLDKKRLMDFLKGQRCKQCGIEKRKNSSRKYKINDLKKFYKEKGCTLLEEEYVNIHMPMKYICICGRESKKSLISFFKEFRCKKCVYQSISGENSPHWNPNLTDEERILERNYPEYTEWRKQVYERDNYTCQCCNQVGGKLNAHHLDGYDWCKEKRIDVDNGITLCEECHIDFHKDYGRGGNTKEQFEEWFNNKNGLFIK